MPSLLNIDEYFVEELHIETNPNYDKSKDSNEVSLSFNFMKNEINPLEFMISMVIFLNQDKKYFQTAKYRILLKLSGYYHFSEGTDEETIDKMISLNGLSILYGVARGVVAQASANCRYGKFILPSVNFFEMLEEKAKSERKKTKKVKKPGFANKKVRKQKSKPTKV